MVDGHAPTADEEEGDEEEEIVKEYVEEVEHEEWRRESTADGRTYFFNKVTGASQWHVPNELYNSRCLDKSSSEEPDNTIEPSASKALMRVDCLTEVPISQRKKKEVVKDVMDRVNAKLNEEEEAEMEVDLGAPEKPQLHVTMVSARGLMDADFMPGRDKSDPFCYCEVVDKPEVQRLQTEVINDNLDPVWDTPEAILEGWEEGDKIRFHIWDMDADPEDNTSLGWVVIDPKEFDGQGVVEFPLEEAGEDVEVDAYLKINVWIKKARRKLSDKVATRLQKQLQKASKKVKLDELIAKYDKDDSGSLSANELRQLIRSELKVPASILSDMDIAALVAALDDDGGGNISTDELQDFIERGTATFYS